MNMNICQRVSVWYVVRVVGTTDLVARVTWQRHYGWYDRFHRLHVVMVTTTVFFVTGQSGWTAPVLVLCNNRQLFADRPEVTKQFSVSLVFVGKRLVWFNREDEGDCHGE